MMTEQQSAREELLAAMDMVLGDGKAIRPEALEALHSIAIAAREYLQAEQAAEQQSPEVLREDPVRSAARRGLQPKKRPRSNGGRRK